jgi:two-component system cell cycle sensor histidine kinase PleC
LGAALSRQIRGGTFLRGVARVIRKPFAYHVRPRAPQTRVNRQCPTLITEKLREIAVHDVTSARQWPTPIARFTGRRLAALGEFRNALNVSVFPATDADARIVDQQLDILRANTRLIPYAIPAAGLAGAFAVSGWVDSLTLVVWLVLLVIAAGVHELASRRFDAKPRTTVADVRRRSVAMTAACFAYLLIWSAFGIIAWAPEIVASHFLVAFVLGCTLAAACTMGAVHLASVVSVAVPAGLLMVLRPLLGDVFDPMAGFCLVYVVLMAAFARSTHNMTTRALQLENDRAGLIDSLRHARDESDSARKRAEQANLAKSEFLANMSHELRTPLNAIIGFSDIIRTRAMGPAREKYTEYAGFINESGNHLLSLISDMLELAKIEAGRKTLREEEVDLADVIAAAMNDIETAAANREVTVEATRGDSMPPLYADRHALRQLLLQILSNAVKFTPPKGYVTVGAQLSQAGEIELIVADNGVGITPEEQLQVFDRFGRGQHDIARGEKGAGLGLPIAKGLAELHGGRIALFSAPGEGTRVIVTFPASRTVASDRLRVVAG